MCEECGVTAKRSKGGGVYGPTCSACHRTTTTAPWNRYKGPECEMCNYKPMFRAALDVHHMDGDKTNNDPSNLQTLCATCHREIEAFLREVGGNVAKAEGLLAKFLVAIGR